MRTVAENATNSNKCGAKTRSKGRAECEIGNRGSIDNTCRTLDETHYLPGRTWSKAKRIGTGHREICALFYTNGRLIIVLDAIAEEAEQAGSVPKNSIFIMASLVFIT